ncbi:MAG: single-stranded-DNA-specific exonuclease RecJ [Sphingomonadaceae bacterium]
MATAAESRNTADVLHTQETQSPFPVTRSASGRLWVWRAAPLPLNTAARLGVDDIAASLFLSRGCAAEDLPRLMRPTLRDWMPDPSLFRDMDKAAARLADAVQRSENIVVFADYDVDGATSAAILIRALRAVGLAPGHYIPDRLLEGYGPSSNALLGLQETGASLILLLDCGTQAFEPLTAAARAGLDVVVVDHHKAGTELPEALALVNPNRLDETPEAARHASLCTAGLAFLLAVALYRELRGRGFFAGRQEPDLAALLEIVALGTVADVVPLTGLNRVLVALGLRRMAQRRNAGIRALFDIAALARAPLAEDCGFVLGPRINAGGRVGQADLGVRLLTTDDDAEAAELAAELDRLNHERRAIEAEVTEAALAQATLCANSAVAVVSGDGWHPGVVGIVAARVKERLNRPAIVLAEGADGVAKGSGRSITGVDLGAAVLAARDSGLLMAGGGHAMAAGVTLETARIGDFTAFLNERLADTVADAGQNRTLSIDLPVAPRGLTPELANALRVAEPYGQGWPTPRVMAGPLRLIKVNPVGKTGDHLRFIGNGADGGRVEGVAFRAADTELGAMLQGAGDKPLFLAGRVQINQWQGRERAELLLDDAAFAR